MIRAKHLRADPVEASDGTRILVSRYYPRGLGGKGNETWSAWLRELAPSRELHAAVKGGAIGLDAYERRFLEEMQAPASQSVLRDLARRSRQGETITLLCDHPRSLPDERCHRFLVKRLVEGLR